MDIEMRILRRESAASAPCWETIPFSTENENETVATALTRINETAEKPIRWECSCLQKKCGACAMVINGRPALACDTFLKKAAKKGRITLEPLKKFPVVADLIVDRSILFENLRTMELWARGSAAPRGLARDTVYEAGRCLQCGCCLEVCPNFCPGDSFFGAAAFVPASRLLAALPKEQRAEIEKNYREHVYAGCGKALSCADICPAGIDAEQLLARSNAAAVWRRPFGRGKG